MNLSNINLDELLTNGLKFGFKLMKKNVEKAVSDNALKVVKSVVFRNKSKPNIKNNNIRLKTGDSVTFVVTKNGLQHIVDEEQHILDEEMPLQSVPTCDHPITSENQYICELCFKNQLKSKL